MILLTLSKSNFTAEIRLINSIKDSFEVGSILYFMLSGLGLSDVGK
jgi:hypothetical protein